MTKRCPRLSCHATEDSMKYDMEKQPEVIERLRTLFKEEGLDGESANRVLDKLAEPPGDELDDFMLGEFLLFHFLKAQVACPSGESFGLAGIARDTTLTLLTTSPDPASTMQGIVTALTINMLHDMQTEQERKVGEAIVASRQDTEECNCPLCQMIDEIMGVPGDGDDLTDEEREALSGGLVPAK